jgi:hypothetical protein
MPARSVPGRRKLLIQPATVPSRVSTSTTAAPRAIASSACATLSDAMSALNGTGQWPSRLLTAGVISAARAGASSGRGGRACSMAPF